VAVLEPEHLADELSALGVLQPQSGVTAIDRFLRRKHAKPDRLGKRCLSFVVGHEARRLEGDRGSDMQYVEGPSAERGGVKRAELGGKVDRATPEHIEDREPPLTNVAIEIRDRRLRDAMIDELAMHRELDGIDDFGAPEPCDRQAASETSPPGAEARGAVVVKVQAPERARIDVRRFSARHE
jgi:hypothetical protein